MASIFLLDWLGILEFLAILAILDLLALLELLAPPYGMPNSSRMRRAWRGVNILWDLR